MSNLRNEFSIAKNKKIPQWPCWYFFLIGATIRIDVNVIGRFAIGELIMFLLFPIALTKIDKLFRTPTFSKIGIFLGLWILGVLISDFFNHTEFDFFIRGLARPLIIFALLVSSYYLTFLNKKSCLYFFFGLLIAGLINYYIPTDFRAVEIVDKIDEDNVDFSYGYYAYVWTPAFFGLASVGGYFIYKFSPLLCGFFQIMLGVTALPIMSRTTGSIFIISGFIIILIKLFPFLRYRFIRKGKIYNSGVRRALVSTLLLFTITYYIYAYAAGNGYLGERQQLKYEQQTKSVFGNTPWGIIINGRHYTIGAILRIMDYPITGAGSWPKQEDTMLRVYVLMGFEPSDQALDTERREIGHSILFGMWAQSGPLVLPFFFLVIGIIFKFTIFTIFSKSPLKPLMLPYLISLLFGIFFNNYNSLARFLMVLVPLMYHFYIEQKPLKLTTGNGK